MPEALRLLVVDVAAEREDAQYTALLTELTAGVPGPATAAGWQVVATFADRGGDDAATRLLAEASACQGVLLMGGEDVDPACYGGPADYPHRGAHQPRADAHTIALVQHCVRSAIPLLGICRGLQIVNVALGGDLHQDIAGHVDRSDPQRRRMTPRRVRIEPGSRLATVLGSEIEVLCSHHQAAATVAAPLAVTARDLDGGVEAVEHRTAPLLAVQWHPEAAGSDPAQLVEVLRLLATLVASPPRSGSEPGSH